jgi:hypothetical protein
LGSERAKLKRVPHAFEGEAVSLSGHPSLSGYHQLYQS